MFSNLAAEFSELFSFGALTTLIVLTLLETVLGFDNLLYITIEAKRADPEQQPFVRRIGTVISLAMSIILLFVIVQLIRLLEAPLFTLDSSWLHTAFSGHALIVMFGGWMLIRTAIREIHHMLQVNDLVHEGDKLKGKRASVGKVLGSMAFMCLIFSFDTAVAAVAFTHNFLIMVLGVLFAGIISILSADKVAAFLQKNRLYEVLGLFVLLLVGIMLVADGGHIAHLTIFGYTVEPIEKSTFYFLLASLIVVDVLQGKFQKKLDREKGSSSNT